MERREEKRLFREERDKLKAEAAQIKFERREARRLKREAKIAEKEERQTRRDAGMLDGLYLPEIDHQCPDQLIIKATWPVFEARTAI